MEWFANIVILLSFFTHPNKTKVFFFIILFLSDFKKKLTFFFLFFFFICYLLLLDKDFVLEDWLMDVEDDFAPDMLQAYLTGDATLMNGLCGDTTKAQVSAFIAEREKNGFVQDNTILDIRGTNLLAARVFEKAPPIMVVQFTAQQINCTRDKKGVIVEGKDDAVTNNFYVVAMQRDWDEEEEELQWKIVEFMILGSMPYQ